MNAHLEKIGRPVRKPAEVSVGDCLAFQDTGSTLPNHINVYYAFEVVAEPGRFKGMGAVLPPYVNLGSVKLGCRIVDGKIVEEANKYVYCAATEFFWYGEPTEGLWNLEPRSGYIDNIFPAYVVQDPKTLELAKLLPKMNFQQFTLMPQTCGPNQYLVDYIDDVEPYLKEITRLQALVTEKAKKIPYFGKPAF